MNGLKIQFVKCIRCGDEFERKPYTGKKYCDGECARLVKNEKSVAAYHRDKPPAKPPREFDCLYCGKSCTTTNGVKKYCNNECTRKHEVIKKREYRKLPVIDHSDDCACGGCMGVEHVRK